MKRRIVQLAGLAPLILGSVALLLGSCSRDDAPNGTTALGDAVALSLSALYTTGSSNTPDAGTRATTTTPFPTDGTKGTIGFFVNASTADKGYTAIDNREGTYDATKSLWLPAAPTIWLNNYPADVAVYAPYDATQTSPGRLYLTPCLRVDDKKDIWSKRLAVNSHTYLEHPAVLAPALEHVYTRLRVTFVKDANYAATAGISSLNASGADICADSWFNLFAADGADAYDRSTQGTSFTVIPETSLDLTADPTTTSAIIDLLLIPATLTGEVTLTVTVDGAAGSSSDLYVNLPATTFTDSKLEAGKQYNVSLTLKPRGLVLSGVRTTNWDEQPEFGGGDLEYPEEEIEPVQIGKYTWAGANLCTSDAGERNFEFEKKPWRAGVYPGEVLEDGTVDADKTNLCYWNWGCLNTPIKTPYLPGDVEWGDTENETLGDPCAKVAPAGTWEVPSKEQFEDLISHLPTNSSSVSINGEKFEVKSETGWAENTKLKVAGQVFVEKDKALFLPAAGGPYNFGTMASVGWSGFYWSRTPHADDLGEYGYYLYSGYDDCNMTYGNRDAGYSVRCVIKNPTGRAGRP